MRTPEPKHMHDELTEDYRRMIYAQTKGEIKNTGKRS